MSSERPQRARRSTTKASTSYLEPSEDPSAADDLSSGDELEAVIPPDDEGSEDEDFTGKRVYTRRRGAPVEGGAPKGGKRTRGPGRNNKVKPAPLPAEKKRRKGGRLGRLEAVLDRLPVEILSEILSHVQPVTLLRLARTAKIFRRLLLSRTSKGIWRTAFANEGIGAFRASDWSEPQWAALILDKECAMCGRLKVHRIDYVYRARYCDKCTRDSQISQAKASELYPDLHPNVWTSTLSTDMTPFWGPGRGAEVYIESALLATSAALFVLAREDLLEPVTEGKSRVAAFVEEKERLIPLIKEDAEMLSAWQRRREEEKSKEKKSLRTDRIAGIKQRCLDAGYSKISVETAMSDRGPTEISPFLDQPYPLTDRVWRKISVPIFKCLDTLRAIEEDVRARIEERERYEARRIQLAEERANEAVIRAMEAAEEAEVEAAVEAAIAEEERMAEEMLVPDLGVGGSGASSAGLGGMNASLGGFWGAMGGSSSQ